MKTLLPFKVLADFVKGFLFMSLDVWNWFAYLSSLKYFKNDPIYKSYRMEVSPLGILYCILDFQEDFFEADDIVQREHLITELTPLFRWMQTNDLSSILNYNQRRIDYRDMYGNLQYSNSVLIKFTFKTTYIKTWRVLTLLGGGYITYTNLNTIQTLINKFLNF